MSSHVPSPAYGASDGEVALAPAAGDTSTAASAVMRRTRTAIPRQCAHLATDIKPEPYVVLDGRRPRRVLEASRQVGRHGGTAPRSDHVEALVARPELVDDAVPLLVAQLEETLGDHVLQLAIDRRDRLEPLVVIQLADALSLEE